MRDNAGNAADYGVGGTWRYTGYSKGYGVEEDSTLNCIKTDLETVDLKVKSTFYRPDGIVSTGRQDQLNSVYFAVPKTIANKYERLQTIKAEWLEYKTGLVGVFNRQMSYDAFLPLIGKKVDTLASDYVFAGNYDYSIGAASSWTYHNADYFYNVGALSKRKTEYDRTYDLLTAAYYEKDIYNTVIAGERLLEDMAKNSADLDGEKLLGLYSKVLFADELDAEHKHENLSEIDADSEYSLTSMTFDKDFLYHFLGIKNYETSVFDGIKAIVEITDEDIIKDTDELSQNLYIDKNDVKAFKEYYNTAKSENKRVYIFRFSKTDYYSTYVWDNVGAVNGIHDNYMFSSVATGFACQQTVFLGFDIIQLKYARDGKYYVIAAVSDPIDIVGDITSPVEKPNDGLPWWLILLIIIIVIIVFVILYKFVKWIVKSIFS